MYIAVFPLCVYNFIFLYVYETFVFLMFLYWCASPLCSVLGRCIFSLFLRPVVVHPSSMHYNMSVIIAISLQERSLYITTQKMNGSELLFVYDNVEMVAAFVVYMFT